ncbi:kinase-like protein [Rhizoclosmatium globosum]|uniref:Kinase-like protein n=1 Tax=Rhizoclosmatium globosum TaxID=329046 RepID=A0A1Y2CBB9_9FUNG|nr:kinase-like protein [Rhizoclosmatium globosum]|eukprot:ORY44329.1 kinase-like protein [Rhizoclosmatium globosum]
MSHEDDTVPHSPPNTTHHHHHHHAHLSLASLLRPFKGGFALRAKAPPRRASQSTDSLDQTHLDHLDNNPHAPHEPHRHDEVHPESRPEKTAFELVLPTKPDSPTNPSTSDPTDPTVEPTTTTKALPRRHSKVLDAFFKLSTDVKSVLSSKRRSSLSSPDHPDPAASPIQNHQQHLYPTPNYPPPSSSSLNDPSFSSSSIATNATLASLDLEAQVEIDAIENLSYLKLQEYKFIKILGAGAQGTVSLRLHIPTSSLRALKSIPTAPSLVDCHVRDSFRREVEILQACRKHPSVIRLLDAWESLNTVYQVFDVMNGGDASVEGVFTGIGEEKGIRLIAPIADALQYLHRLQILHRDVRPANIFLRRSITGHETLRELEHIPVLADFGIANYMRNSGRLAAPFPETPAHIAPEILTGSRFSSASDCYGLGYYALHLLLQRQPTVEDVRHSGEIADVQWGFMSDIGRRALKGLLEVDPLLRTTAAEFCVGEWVEFYDVDCVKHAV